MKKTGWKLTNILGSVFFVAILSVPAAYAEHGPGGYFGIGLGQGFASDFCDPEPGFAIATCEDNDTVYKLYGGIRFSPNVALEIGYFNGGNYPASGTFLGNPFALDAEVSGLTVQAVGIAPVSDTVSLFAKGGLVRWNLDFTGTVNGVPINDTDNGIDFVFGLGGELHFSPNLALRAEWEIFPDLGDNDTGENTVHALTAGLVFSF